MGDEVFKLLVLARIVEPTSKADTIRGLEEIGVAAPAPRTIFLALARCVERDYRNQLATAWPGTLRRYWGGSGLDGAV